MKDMQPITSLKPHFWLATDLMEHLGYKNWPIFSHHVEEAVKIMIMLNIPYYNNIIPIERKQNDKLAKDFQLSRFACYLVVMFADRKKEKVLEAQDRFTRKAEKQGIFIKDLFELKRIALREELTEGTKLLTNRITKAEVSDYSAFIDAGYMGLYNLSSQQLHERRKLPKDKRQQEYMGRLELATNLMLCTLTEQTVWMKKIKGQANLEKYHNNIGASIRNLINNHLDIYPENLPIYRDLQLLKKQLKEGYLKMIDPEKVITVLHDQ